MKKHIFWITLIVIISFVACGGSKPQQKASKATCEMCGEADGLRQYLIMTSHLHGTEPLTML